MKRILHLPRRAPRTLESLAVLALTALLCWRWPSARAQGGPAGGADADPPDRVARLSEASGKVWLLRAPKPANGSAVERNRPLTTGDRDRHRQRRPCRDRASARPTLRLDSATELEIVLLDNDRINLHLHSGSVAARLRNRARRSREFTLDTDEGRFRAAQRRPLSLRSLRAGQRPHRRERPAAYESRNSALPLGTGRSAEFWLDASGAPQYSMLEPLRDNFAAWTATRDRAEARPVAATRYVSPEMTGGRRPRPLRPVGADPRVRPDLDAARRGGGWAPYRYGHWAYVRPWGWTWVDDAPWGFAPFHYGRWVHFAAAGAGRPAPTSPGRSTRRRWWPGSAARTSTSRSRSAAQAPRRSAGSRWRRAKSMCPHYRHSPAYVRNINVDPRDQRHPDHDHRQQHQRRGRSARLRQSQVPACGDGGARQAWSPAARRWRPRQPGCGPIRQVRALVADRAAGGRGAAPSRRRRRRPSRRSGKVAVDAAAVEGRPPGLTGRPGQERRSRARRRRHGLAGAASAAAPVPAPRFRPAGCTAPNAAPQATIAPRRMPPAAERRRRRPTARRHRPPRRRRRRAATERCAAAECRAEPNVAAATDRCAAGERHAAAGRCAAARRRRPRSRRLRTTSVAAAAAADPKAPGRRAAAAGAGAAAVAPSADPRQRCGRQRSACRRARGGERPVIRPLEPRPIDASRVVRPVEPAHDKEAAHAPPPRVAAPRPRRQAAARRSPRREQHSPKAADKPDKADKPTSATRAKSSADRGAARRGRASPAARRAAT